MRHKKQTGSPAQDHRATRRFWQKAFLGVLAGLLLISLLSLDVLSTQAKPTKVPQSSGNAYDVIAGVNSVRSAHGLPPFQVNGALMASAQGHSQYQASIRSATHSGSGGSDPKSRAIAAGYGGGVTVYVSENIYSGMGATPQNAVSWWQGDSLHLNTMVNPNYTDIGAGVATDGSVVYYTIDVGYLSGSPGTGGGAAGYTPGAVSTPLLTPAAVFNPVVVSTPGPDGSIVHTVAVGQSLWSIATTYKIQLPDLLKLNGLADNALIFPGDKLVIKSADGGSKPALASAPVASEAPSLPEMPTPSLLSMHQPATAIAMSQPAQDDSVALPASSPPAARASSGMDPVILVIAGLVFGGVSLIVVGNLLKRAG